MNAFLLLFSICNLWCSVHILKYLEKASAEQEKPNPPSPTLKKSNSKRGPASLLEFIPTNKEGIFTYQNYLAARRAYGLDDASANKTLSKWKSRGYIEYLENSTYKKLREGDIYIIYGNN